MSVLMILAGSCKNRYAKIISESLASDGMRLASCDEITYFWDYLDIYLHITLGKYNTSFNTKFNKSI